MTAGLYIHAMCWQCTPLPVNNAVMANLFAYLPQTYRGAGVGIVTGRIHHCTQESGSSVSKLRAGRAGFDSLRGNGFFLFSTKSRPYLGPTQTPIQCVMGAFFFWDKAAGV